MALNIGAINFGVDASTEGLKKAIDQLRVFQRVVNQTARSQQQGAAEAAAALGRQESAIKRAFQQTLNLRRALLQASAAPESLARVSNAFRRLTAEMTSGRLSTVQFSRAVDAFNARINRSSRELKDLKAKQAATQFEGMVKVLRDLRSAAVLLVGPLSGIGARFSALSALASATSLRFAGVVGAIVAVAVALFKVSTAAVRAVTDIQRIQAALTVATGSVRRAQAEFDFVVDTSKRLGLSLQDTASGFARLSAATVGTALQGKRTRDAFLGVVEASAALGLSGEATRNVLIALEQMLSIGTVRSQELKTQLGNNLPGAFRLAAEAMNVPIEKLQRMLETGQILSDDFIPKFTKRLHELFGEEAQNNINRLYGAWQRFKTVAIEAVLQWDKLTGTTTTLSKILQFFTVQLEDIAAGMKFLNENLSAAGTLFRLMAAQELPKVTEAMKSLYALGVAKLTEGFQHLKDVASATIDILGRGFDYLVEKATSIAAGIGALFDSIVGYIKQKISSIFELTPLGQIVVEWLEKAVAKGFDALKGTLSDKARAVFDALLGTSESTSKGLNSMWDSVSKTMRDVAFAFEVAKRSMLGGADAADDAVAAATRLGPKFDEVTQSVQDLLDNIDLLRESNRRLASGGLTDIDISGFENARKLIRKLTDTDLVAFQDKLKELATAAHVQITFEGPPTRDNLIKLLETLFLKEEQLKKAQEDYLTKLKNTPETVRDIQTSFTELQGKIAALQKGPRAVELFNINSDVVRAVEQMHDKLRRTVLTEEEQNRILSDYQKLLERAAYLQDHMSTVSSDWAQAIAQGLDDAIFSGKKFGDVLTDLGKKLLQLTFQSLVLDPFQKALSGSLEHFFHRGAAAPTGGDPYAGLASAKGHAFSSGVMFMARGGILRGPTMFGTKRGIAIGGEAGDEAVLPLARGAGGRLGVMAAGGGGAGVMVQIIDQRSSRDSAPVEVEEGTSAAGMRQLRILIRDTIKGMHNSGEMDRVLGSNFGLTRKGTR